MNPDPKQSTRAAQQKKGSALMTVVLIIAVMTILSASMLKYSGSEERANERNRLILRARNMAENISLYAAEQITTKLYRQRSSAARAFLPKVAGDLTDLNQVFLPPANWVLNSAYSDSATGMEVYAGLSASTPLTYIDPKTDPSNPDAGLQVITSTVPIIAKATTTQGSIGSITAYCEQDMEVAAIPLFQFAIFYNMDLEFGPGADMIISGPVHANGNFYARDQNTFTNTVQFNDRVTTAGSFYAKVGKTLAGVYGTYNEKGVLDTADGGTGPLNFTNATTGTITGIFDSSIGGTGWRDHLWGTGTETATTMNNFKAFATSTYGGNLRTSVHGVTPLVLPAVSNYSQTDDPSTTDVDERDNGRQIIEPPLPTDSAGMMDTKLSRNVGLYIVVNPTDQPRAAVTNQSIGGVMPDGSAIPNVLPRSYRCWLNFVNSDGTHSMREVILPGQPTYGYDNNGTPADLSDDFSYRNLMPNAYILTTSIGSNQVLRIPQQPAGVGPTGGRAGAILPSIGNAAPNTGYSVGAGVPLFPTMPDAYFYDMRRATGNVGYPATRSILSLYTPQPVAKIDFDMTRFKLAVERTLSGLKVSSADVYDPTAPSAANWTYSIYNSAGVPNPSGYNLGLGVANDFPTDSTRTAPDPYEIYYAPTKPDDPLITTDPNGFADPSKSYRVPASDLIDTAKGISSPWFDGITVYIQSIDAELRGQTAGVPNRTHSGVRLWNGRGPVISLDGATYPGCTGMTLVTNDVVYIVGHFNADGVLNTDPASTGAGGAESYGGYSARYADSAAERLTSVMGDAINILSQPTYSTAAYAQVSGWADWLSDHIRNSSATGYDTNWRRKNPSATNTLDGVNTSYKPVITPTASAMLPNSGNSVSGTGSAQTAKFAPTPTEVSACLLIGIVPTNHDPSTIRDDVFNLPLDSTGNPSPGPNGQTSGGVHNYPRLQENWNGTALYIRGSMVAMFESRVAMEPWTIRVYSGAGRFWGLHQSLRDSKHDVPLEPMVLNSRRMRFNELNAADYETEKKYIESLPH